ncbi:hypothetical protein AYI69_g11022 [Smittium culicis]|uniref:SH3 domain-containing protein n=1 Tax=Smittium culicis TaxID=133412 RepID=A0A1R1X1V8_9FUNG|nr:hypothetical protein AYI69_g11022 [Smittium culicis]
MTKGSGGSLSSFLNFLSEKFKKKSSDSASTHNISKKSLLIQSKKPNIEKSLSFNNGIQQSPANAAPKLPENQIHLSEHTLRKSISMSLNELPNNPYFIELNLPQSSSDRIVDENFFKSEDYPNKIDLNDNDINSKPAIHHSDSVIFRETKRNLELHLLKLANEEADSLTSKHLQNVKNKPIYSSSNIYKSSDDLESSSNAFAMEMFAPKNLDLDLPLISTSKSSRRFNENPSLRSNYSNQNNSFDSSQKNFLHNTQNSLSFTIKPKSPKKNLKSTKYSPGIAMSSIATKILTNPKPESSNVFRKDSKNSSTGKSKFSRNNSTNSNSSSYSYTKKKFANPDFDDSGYLKKKPAFVNSEASPASKSSIYSRVNNSNPDIKSRNKSKLPRLNTALPIPLSRFHKTPASKTADGIYFSQKISPPPFQLSDFNPFSPTNDSSGAIPYENLTNNFLAKNSEEKDSTSILDPEKHSQVNIFSPCVVDRPNHEPHFFSDKNISIESQESRESQESQESAHPSIEVYNPHLINNPGFISIKDKDIISETKLQNFDSNSDNVNDSDSKLHILSRKCNENSLDSNTSVVSTDKSDHVTTPEAEDTGMTTTTINSATKIITENSIIFTDRIISDNSSNSSKISKYDIKPDIIEIYVAKNDPNDTLIAESNELGSTNVASMTETRFIANNSQKLAIDIDIVNNFDISPEFNSVTMTNYEKVVTSNTSLIKSSDEDINYNDNSIENDEILPESSSSDIEEPTFITSSIILDNDEITSKTSSVNTNNEEIVSENSLISIQKEEIVADINLINIHKEKLDSETISIDNSIEDANVESNSIGNSKEDADVASSSIGNSIIDADVVSSSIGNSNEVTNAESSSIGNSIIDADIESIIVNSKEDADADSGSIVNSKEDTDDDPSSTGNSKEDTDDDPSSTGNSKEDTDDDPSSTGYSKEGADVDSGSIENSNEYANVDSSSIGNSNEYADVDYSSIGNSPQDNMSNTTQLDNDKELLSGINNLVNSTKEGSRIDSLSKIQNTKLEIENIYLTSNYIASYQESCNKTTLIQASDIPNTIDPIEPKPDNDTSMFSQILSPINNTKSLSDSDSISSLDKDFSKDQNSLNMISDSKNEPTALKIDEKKLVRVQIYGSSVSGNRKYKTESKLLFNILKVHEIEYEFICIAADEKSKLYMRRKALGNMQIPQIYVDKEFKGLFDAFIEANESNTLVDWLGLNEEPFEF